MVADLINDPDPKTMVECKQRSDWIKWKEAIELELDSLRKREVFSNAIPTPPRIHPVGFKWVFTWKWNENNELVRYKVSHPVLRPNQMLIVCVPRNKISTHTIQKMDKE
jgi:hypothetical protein